MSEEVHLLSPPYREFELVHGPRRLGEAGPTRGSLIAVRPGADSTWSGIARTITGLQRRCATAPVILWLDRVLPAELPVLASRAQAMGVCAFVVDPSPDPSLLRRQLTDPADLPKHVTRWLRHRGSKLDPELRALVARLVHYAPEYRTLAKLAANRGPADWQWRRQFERAGIGHPGAWFQVMRMLGIALTLQRDDTVTVAKVAERYRIFDASALSRRCEEVLGARPRYIRKWLGWQWLLLPALRRSQIPVPPRTGTRTV